jgi:YD repeat-containing protein
MVRRFVAVALLGLFVCESSGAAAAVPTAHIPAYRQSASLLAQAQLGVARLVRTLSATEIGALLTGQESRWNVMHAAPPTFERAHTYPTADPHPILHYSAPSYGQSVRFPEALKSRVLTVASITRDPLLAQSNHGSRHTMYSPPTYTYSISASPTSVTGAAGSTATITLQCTKTPSNGGPTTVSCSGVTATSSNTAVATVSIGTIGSSTTPSTISYTGAGAATITYTWSSQTATVGITASQGAGSSPPPTLAPSPVPEATPSTGVNSYWTYEEYVIPGAGMAMVNIANGNLLVQSDDMDLRERGIDLAFQRTYNSQAPTTAVAPYLGTGWSSTFEASIKYSPTAGTLTVYDIDGAAYTYTANGSTWTPPAGQHATLAFDGCSYVWQKKSGTQYKFAPPDITTAPTSCGYTNAAQDNRVMMIVGRDVLNYITFTYSFDSSGNVTKVIVAHANGQSLTLGFGTNHLLSSVSRSADGASVTFGYDGNGNLGCVNGLTNNTGYATYCYTWNGSHQLVSVSSPRWQQTAGNEGGFTSFTYDAYNHVTSITRSGIANFTPSDGASPQQILQPLLAVDTASAPRTISQDNFSYTSAQTELTDLDGHGTRWTSDSLARVTQTQEWNGSIWLVTNASWDSNDNLTSTVDARGYETDYAYDAMGNTLAVELPSTTTSQGTTRPTDLYSYDSYNNLRSYCDPTYTLAHGLNWTVGSPPAVCPTTPGSVNAPGPSVYAWSTPGSSQYDANEQYGRLTDSYTPMGYRVTYAYASTAQGGDYGLPSEATGATMSQIDGTSRTPDVNFVYDSNTGDVLKYSALPVSSNAWTQFTYDSVGDPLTVTDADGHTSYKCYYQNGQLQYSETPAQHGMDGNLGSCQNTAPTYADGFTYDSDGNVKTQTRHFSNTTGNAGQTTRWYDGADRLVEVQQPQDNSDVYGFSWMTRYIYDLSQNSTTGQSINGTYFRAHGNLAKTQECLASTSVTAPYNTKPAGCTFTDTKAQAFDEVDRLVTKYSFAGSNLYQEVFSYDAQALYGLLVSDCTGSLPCKTFTYTPLGQTVTVAHNDSGATPDSTYTYDVDGRTVSIASSGSSLSGAQTYSYNGDGRLTQSVEPSGYQSSPATLTYHYYADGKRQSLDVSSSALTQTGLYQYAYRQDGKIQTQQINTGSFMSSASTTLSFNYSNAGRENTLTFSGNGAPAGNPTYSYDQYGQELSESVGSAGQSQRTYDAEGELTSYLLSGQSSASTFTYTTRGELLQGPQSTSPSFATATPTNFANGVKVAAGSGTLNSETISTSSTFDARMGAVQSWKESCVSGCGSSWTGNPCATDTTGTYCPYENFSYDTEGRMTQQVRASFKFDSSTGYVDETDTTTVNAYDTENRLTNTQVNPGTQSSQQRWYTWGPNGHPVSESFWETNNAGVSSRQNNWLHWDGDQLLFVTGPNGQLVDVKIGTLGDITLADTNYTGITFYGRNPAGDISLCYNKAGINGSFGYSTPRGNWLCPYVSGAVPSFQYSFNDGSGTAYGKVPIYLGSDGVYDWLNTIQGVRTYDSDSGGWTTPDAYAGDAHDPMSQKSYVWDADNAVSFSDPSGYSACPSPQQWQIPSTHIGWVCMPPPATPPPHMLEAVLILAIPIDLDVIGGAIAARGLELLAESLAKRFGTEAVQAVLRKFAAGGVRALERTIASMDRNIAEHWQKIAEALGKGATRQVTIRPQCLAR